MFYRKATSSQRLRLACGLRYSVGIFTTTAILMSSVCAAANAAGPLKVKTVYSFQNLPDGRTPVGDLLTDNQGDVFGTTELGGSAGYGTVWELSPVARGGSGFTFKVLHTFTGGTSDGAAPEAGVINVGGTLYGTTVAGGSPSSYGVIYALTPAPGSPTGWTETVLHSFSTYEASPSGTLVADASGNLYGTSYYGGDAGGGFGAGIVYELQKPGVGGDAWKYIALHVFNGNDGSYPEGSVGVTPDGKHVYGAYSYYGPGGFGGIFELTNARQKWVFKNLYDADQPSGGVLLHGGVMYFTTAAGGYNFTGELDSLARSGKTWKDTKLGDMSQDCGYSTNHPIWGGAAGLFGTNFGNNQLNACTYEIRLSPPNQGFSEVTNYPSTVAAPSLGRGGKLWGVSNNGGTGGYGAIFEVLNPTQGH